MRVRAFAKINLSLRVVGTSADGYHELRTVFQSIALHDTLTFRRTRGPFRLSCSDPACPIDDANLVWRAADLMWRAARRPGTLGGVSVRITKRIPIGSGLGGGSSDAAATLRACAALWRARVTARELKRMAAALGADVPFFLEGGTALGTGRGDILTRLPDTAPAWVVLAVPSFGVSTKDAYGWWDADHRGEPGSAAGELGNDLQSPVAARHPDIARTVAALASAGASQAAMSGSGSAVFGLFASRAAAERAARRLGGRSRCAIVTRVLNRMRYQALAGL
jgi:4-diphosphocytidyl-2-C-methyl-D-erythritol kinase